MQTRERGGEEERLNLLGDDDSHLDEAPTAWRERGPRTANGPVERSLSESEEEGKKAREREGERDTAWWLVGNKNKNSRGLERLIGR